MKEKAPAYIAEVKRIVDNKPVTPLKDVFMALRKDFPEVENMRTLKINIEKHLDGMCVNQNNLIISKSNIFDDIMNILK